MAPTHVLAYDVADDGLRRRIRSQCRAFGGHQQYSVFVFQLSSTEREEIVGRIESLVTEADGTADVRLWGVHEETVIATPESNGRDTDEEGIPANIV